MFGNFNTLRAFVNYNDLTVHQRGTKFHIELTCAYVHRNGQNRLEPYFL